MTDAKPPTLNAPLVIEKFWRTRWRQESVHVELSFFEERYLINVRIYRTGIDGVDRATTKGITLSVAKLGELARALVKAEATARSLNLIPPTNDGGGE